MNEKLKRLALKLEDYVEYYDIPQQVYDELLELATKQKDYFEMIGAENIIKLTFLIYSYKRTSSFELGEQMLNDSMFYSHSPVKVIIIVKFVKNVVVKVKLIVKNVMEKVKSLVVNVMNLERLLAILVMEVELTLTTKKNPVGIAMVPVI
jgi:hypothetical protein